jgi:hypothetical protein
MLLFGAQGGERGLLAVAQPLLVERGVDPRPQQDRIERLRQVVFGAGLDRTHDAVELVERRDHDDRDVARRFRRFQAAEHLEPADPGHHQIEQYEIEIAVCGGGERRGAARCAGHAMALALEAARQQIAIGGVVVDDEDVALPVGGRLCFGGGERTDLLQHVLHRLDPGLRRKRRPLLAGERDDPVDLAEQPVGVPQHLFEVAAPLRAAVVARLFEEQLAVALDRGQRGSEFVAQPALESPAARPIGVEDAGDQRGELRAGGAHAFEIGDPLRQAVAPRVFEQNVEKAEDRRNRGSELLAQERGERLPKSSIGLRNGQGDVPPLWGPRAGLGPIRASILPISRGNSTGFVS